MPKDIPRLTVPQLVAINKHAANNRSDYYWCVTYRDDAGELQTLTELKEDGSERLYKEVWDLEQDHKVVKVEWVRARNPGKGKRYGVNLVEGTLEVGGEEFVATSQDGNVLSFRQWDYRGIAIRRTQEDFVTQTGQPLGGRIIFTLGWQATIQERNIRALLFILPSGHVALGRTHLKSLEFLDIDAT